MSINFIIFRISFVIIVPIILVSFQCTSLIILIISHDHDDDPGAVKDVHAASPPPCLVTNYHSSQSRNLTILYIQVMVMRVRVMMVMVMMVRVKTTAVLKTKFQLNLKYWQHDELPE